MLNMIKLDWLGMKYYWSRVVLYTVFACLLGLMDPVLIIPIMTLQMLYMSYYPFMAEEKGKLEYLYFTLPVSRKAAVKARFGLAFVMQSAGIVIGIVSTIIIAKILNGQSIFSSLLHSPLTCYQPELGSMILLICGSLVVCAFLTLFMYPVLYKLGYTKGKVWGFYIPTGIIMVLSAVIGAVWGFGIRSGGIGSNDWFVTIQSLAEKGWLSLILIAVAALLCAASYALSQVIYSKREF